MEKIEVGKPYPQPLELRDGLATQPMPSGLMSLVHLSRFERGDLAAFRGPMTVAVAQMLPDVPWLALRFHKSGLVLDGPILVGHRQDLQENLEKADNLLQVVFLEGLRYTVRHIRALGLRPDLVDVIKSALGQPPHIGRLQQAALRVQRQYPTSDDVYLAAEITQRFE